MGGTVCGAGDGASDGEGGTVCDAGGEVVVV